MIKSNRHAFSYPGMLMCMVIHWSIYFFSTFTRPFPPDREMDDLHRSVQSMMPYKNTKNFNFHCDSIFRFILGVIIKGEQVWKLTTQRERPTTYHTYRTMITDPEQCNYSNWMFLLHLTTLFLRMRLMEGCFIDFFAIKGPPKIWPRLFNIPVNNVSEISIYKISVFQRWLSRDLGVWWKVRFNRGWIIKMV